MNKQTSLRGDSLSLLFNFFHCTLRYSLMSHPVVCAFFVPTYTRPTFNNQGGLRWMRERPSQADSEKSSRKVVAINQKGENIYMKLKKICDRQGMRNILKLFQIK